MKDVAVIGVGASGLAAIRSLVKCKEEVNITAYELSDRVGGLWVNRSQYMPTCMYDCLKTNVPKELFGFTGFPFPPNVRESFLSHTLVLEYVQSFTKHYSMYQYIKFKHRVLEVDPFKTDGGKDRWYVTVRNEITGAVTTKQFDAVMVCCGHESVPYIPKFEGEKTFTGEIIHSRYYQSSEYYQDKAVIIAGAGFSGTDILMDIQTVAAKVYLSHAGYRFKNPFPDNAEQVTVISKIDGENIVLKDGRVLQADVIILATGYKFDFSFLSEKCRPQVMDGHVANIYRMMVDIRHPSLYYIGLNKLSVLYRQFSYQSELAVAFITEKIPQIRKEEMQKEYHDLYRKLVTNAGREPKEFHITLDYQFEYHDILVKQSLTDEPVYPVTEKLINRVMYTFSKNFHTFRQCVYKAVGDDDFEILYQPSEFED